MMKKLIGLVIRHGDIATYKGTLLLYRGVKEKTMEMRGFFLLQRRPKLQILNLIQMLFSLLNITEITWHVSVFLHVEGWADGIGRAQSSQTRASCLRHAALSRN